MLFGSINIRTGHRLSLVRLKQRAGDFQAFLELVHDRYRAWRVVMRLDGDSSHTAKASQRRAVGHDVELVWLPMRSPHLNPMDHLWRHSKGDVSANRQYASIEELARHALDDLHGLSHDDALRKAGLQYKDFWLYNL